MTSLEPSEHESSRWGCTLVVVLMLGICVWPAVYVWKLLQPTETRAVSNTVLSPSGRLKAEVIDVWWSGFILTIVTSELRISEVDHPELGGLALGYSGSRDLPEWLDDQLLRVPLPNDAVVGRRSLQVKGGKVSLSSNPTILLRDGESWNDDRFRREIGSCTASRRNKD
jgi:hypothetical protein